MSVVLTITWYQVWYIHHTKSQVWYIDQHQISGQVYWLKSRILTNTILDNFRFQIWYIARSQAWCIDQHQISGLVYWANPDHSSGILTKTRCQDWYIDQPWSQDCYIDQQWHQLERVTNISPRSSKLEWVRGTRTLPYISRIKKVIQRTYCILGTLSTEYNQQACTDF